MDVYIDDVYVGNTLNVAEILDTKRQYEADLSARYGSPVVLECKIGFVPGEYRENEKIPAGDTAIFNDYMARDTKRRLWVIYRRKACGGGVGRKVVL